jgi:hypothetical protein
VTRPLYYPGTAAGRAAAAEFAVIAVDGKTHFVCKTPALDRPAFAHRLDGERVRVSLVATEAPNAEPIHPTLDGPAVYVGGAAYTRAFHARDLLLRLAPFAGGVIYARIAAGPLGVLHLPLRVLWATGEPFLPPTT